MVKRCLFCGRYFTPDRRVGERQKACQRPECKKARKRLSQRAWHDNNPGYFKNHYIDYIKPWRQKRRGSLIKKDEINDNNPQVIKDEIPLSNSLQKLILLIPAGRTAMIKDKIILRRVGRYTFSAYG